MKRVRTSHKAGEVAPNTFPDFDWFRQNRETLFTTYGECVVLVYNQQVIGTGKTIEEAVQKAENNLSPDVQEVTPIVEYLSNRHPLFHLRLK